MKREKIWSTFIVVVLIFLVLGLIYYFSSIKEEIVMDNNPVASDLLSTSTNQKNNGTTEVVNVSTEESKTYLNSDGVYVVEYTNNGFVPSALKIPRGKSVKFINVSNKGMRIFSNEKKDSKFMELNESKTIGKGSSYTFSFVYAGLWSYYNQSSPKDTASILVY